MNNVMDFYDKLDLKYPEIGVAMQPIDRRNPGRVKINIPILTPLMDNSKEISRLDHQYTRNLMNAEKNIDIKNIEVKNYIYIPIPKELCYVHDEEDSIIPTGSKWLIVFVGGDITKPRVIARYLE